MVRGGADIQPENGFVKIHPAILELLARKQLSGREFRCLLFLFRKTYGYQKKEDSISLSQWAEGTDIPRTRVGAVLESLVIAGIIKRTDNGTKRPATWGFNKYFEGWQGCESVTQEGDTVAESVTLQGDSLDVQSVTLQGDSCKPSVTLQGDKSVTLQGDNNRKKEGIPNGGNDYFGMKRPFSREHVTADGYTQDAAKEGVNAECFREITDTLITVAGWQALVNAGDDAKLNFAKHDAIMLIRMGTKTTKALTALIDAYRASYPKRTTIQPRDLSAYASQLLETHGPANTASNISGFALSDVMGD